MMKRFDKKENLGITLIALVITIIILLILAGVTISQLSENGLFKNAKTAKEKSDNAQELEETKLAEYDNEISNYIGASRDNTPVYLDGNEHEIGMFGNKKLYQKTFIDKNVTISGTTRAWYTILDNNDLDDLNIDTFFIDEGNSFIKLVYTKGTNNGLVSNLPINRCWSDTASYNCINTNKYADGTLSVGFCCSGYEQTNSTNGIQYYITLTLKYTKTEN